MQIPCLFVSIDLSHMVFRQDAEKPSVEDFECIAFASEPLDGFG